MASPILPGTSSSSAISSKSIHILEEKIHIDIDETFTTATCVVEYFIETQTAGLQIPLLFYAQDYNPDFYFKVWVDNEEVSILDSENKSISLDNFHLTPDTLSGNTLDRGDISISALKYFETHLSQGRHTVRVEYVSTVWIYRSGWINEYSFHYALAPAKHWKSFGKLQITLDSCPLCPPLTTNLGPPAKGSLASGAT